MNFVHGVNGKLLNRRILVNVGNRAVDWGVGLGLHLFFRVAVLHVVELEDGQRRGGSVQAVSLTRLDVSLF